MDYIHSLVAGIGGAAVGGLLGFVVGLATDSRDVSDTVLAVTLNLALFCGVIAAWYLAPRTGTSRPAAGVVAYVGGSIMLLFGFYLAWSIA